MRGQYVVSTRIIPAGQLWGSPSASGAASAEASVPASDSAPVDPSPTGAAGKAPASLAVGAVAGGGMLGRGTLGGGGLACPHAARRPANVQRPPPLVAVRARPFMVAPTIGEGRQPASFSAE